jgi:acetyl esterase/lipase
MRIDDPPHDSLRRNHQTMMTRTISGIATLALMVLALPALGAQGPKVKTENDLVYTKAGATELKLDMARPAEGDGPFPAVLVIHGGGWRGGNKSQMRGLLAEFARRGYVAVSPQYRLCPKETFPAQVHDVKAAVRWIKSHAKDYQVDPDHVGAVGFSAGAHLAMMLGVTGPDDGLEGEAPDKSPSTKIQAVVSYAGPTDLAATDLPEVSQPLVRDFLGGSPKDKPEIAAKASPLTFVSKGDAPLLSFQGTKDTLVPHTQAVKLIDAMTAAEVPGRVELIIGAGHGLTGDDLKRTVSEMFEFFDHYLRH